MQDWKLRKWIIFCAMIITLNVSIIIAHGFNSHITNGIPEELASSIGMTVVAGSLMWYLRRWRYIRITGISILLCFFGYSAIFCVIKGKILGILIGSIASAWMTYEVIKEIAKFRSHDELQQTDQPITAKD
jgi:hypothetical protein